MINFTSSNRARLVEEIINYRDVNKFIFSELNILQYVNEAINKNQDKFEIADFKYSMNEYIKKHIFLDCKVQIENVFKTYSDEIPPYIFLTNVRENEDDLKSNLGKNVVAAYKNKLRNLLWFTSEDREIINNASNVKEEFLKRKKMWKNNKYNEAIQVSD